VLIASEKKCTAALAHGSDSVVIQVFQRIDLADRRLKQLALCSRLGDE
jgi:hypothetical protein